MKIELTEIRIEDLVRGYVNNNEDGVYAYDGKLSVRPPYQREFCYKDKQQRAVVESILKGFPLGTMYWVLNEDNTFELLDGQQRTLSICEFVRGQFNIDNRFFTNLLKEEQDRFLNYKIYVYVCSGGTESEKLDWFRTINIAGEKLTEQELLNINYMGPWLADAKAKFSKSDCAAFKIGSRYVKGNPIRQDYLETVLNWISGGYPASYMSAHQHDAVATPLINYFTAVINWVGDIFRNYRSEMLGLDWGDLYNRYKDIAYDPAEVETKVRELMENEEVTDKRGIYEYVLSGCDEAIARCLSKRSFSKADKRTVYEKQEGVCPICGEKHAFEDMDGDHIVPWWRGGTTTIDNLQMLCRKCNNGKGGKMKQ